MRADRGALSRLWGGKGPFVVVLVAAALLRVHAVVDLYPGEISIGGDALEYCQNAEHILRPAPVSPPGRMPGFPLLLAALFRALPFPHAAVQVWTAALLSTLVVGLAMRLALLLAGRRVSLMCGALVAGSHLLIANGALGLSEELAVALTAGALVIHVSGESGDRPAWHGLALGLVSGALVATRTDAALAVVPVLAATALTDARDWRAGRAWYWLLVIAPIALCALGAQQFSASSGATSPYWRHGRSLFFMEYLRGRVPYDYMFYYRIGILDWLLDHRSAWGAIAMVARSSARVVLGLGEALGGQAVTLVAIWGMVACRTRRGAWAVIAAVPLSVATTWALVAVQDEGAFFRYLTRSIPFVAVFAAVGWESLTTTAANRLRATARLGLVIGGSAAVLLILAASVPMGTRSVYRWARSSSSSDRTEAEMLIGRDVQPRLAQAWMRSLRGEWTHAQTVDALGDLQERAPRYALTYFVRGLVYLRDQQLGLAAAELRQSQMLVPYLAEAGCWLAEVEWLRGDRAAALDVIGSTTTLRADYPLGHLEKAQMLASVGRMVEALAAYEAFLTAASTRALERIERILLRSGRAVEAEGVRATMRSVGTPDYPLVSEEQWGYLSLDLAGIYAPAPLVENVYLSMGVLCARQELWSDAAKYLRYATIAAPDRSDTWRARAALAALLGNRSDALLMLEEGAVRSPDSKELADALARLRIGAGSFGRAREDLGSEAGQGRTDPSLAAAATAVASVGSGAALISFPRVPIRLPMTRAEIGEL